MIRVFYLKSIIEAELSFEKLTPREQIDFLLRLIQKANEDNPEARLFLARVTDKEEYPESLDW